MLLPRCAAGSTSAPLDATEHAELLVEAWRHADGYRLIFWHGSVPEAHLAQAAYLDGRLLEDAPLGELNWEPAKMDTSRFRSMEQAVMAAGGAVPTTPARCTIRPAGWRHSRHSQWTRPSPITLGRTSRSSTPSTAGIGSACSSAGEPGPGSPGGTGLAVLDTWNSEGNHRMIAINEIIGYRPVDRWSNWQLAI